MRELNTQEGETFIEVPEGLIIDPDKYKIGENNELLPYAPPVDEQKLWRHFRAERNRKLAATDWTQLSDATANKDAWAAYRQALRDLPSIINDPNNVSWPVPPS